MKTKLIQFTALCGVCTLGPVFAAETSTPPIHPQADRLFREASACLAAAKAFSFKAEIWDDTVVAGHKVATTKTVDVKVRRPDGVQMEIRSPKRSRGIWYDGKSVTLLDRGRNLYGTFDAPATIEQTLDAANDQYGVNFPLEDLLVNDPYASAAPAIKGGAYFGAVKILGTTCHHIAFSTSKVDWQLWIQDGPNPLPRKLVITYKQEDTAPQWTAIFSDWKIKSGLPAKAFTFAPPKGSARIEVLPAADTE